MSAGPDDIRIADASFRVDTMPPAGRALELSVGPEERALVAEALGISAVESLEVRLQAVRFRGGLRVTGELVAETVQPSVITLEPVRQAIREPVDRVFLPGTDKHFSGTPGAEIYVDLEAEDTPDHFEGPEADMSALIIETLALALDPYPKAEGESLDALGLPEPDPDESPFARLKSLTKGDQKG